MSEPDASATPEAAGTARGEFTVIIPFPPAILPPPIPSPRFE